MSSVSTTIASRRMVARVMLRSVIGTLMVASCTISYGDQPSLAELRRIAEARAEQALSEAESSRNSIIALALEVRASQQAEARTEAERLAREAKQLQFRMELRRWALGSFEGAQRNVTTSTRFSSKYLDHLQRSQELARRRRVEFPQLAVNEIKSGTALNEFLTACGAVALQNSSARELLVERLKATDLSDEARQDIKEMLRNLEWIRGQPMLGESQRSRLRYRNGQSVQALIIQSRDATDPALPLNWPPAIAADSAFRDSMSAMESAKASALADLRAGKGIDYETDGATLLEAADGIRRLVNLRYAQHAAGPSDGRRLNDLIEARTFSASLCAGARVFIQARQLSDVAPSEAFRGETVEDLLAFMVRQGFTFAPADALAEGAYQAVYTQLVEYYLRWQGLRLSQESDERQMAELRNKMDQVYETGYGGNAVRDLEQLLRARPQRDLLDLARDLSATVANISETIERIDKRLKNNSAP